MFTGNVTTSPGVPHTDLAYRCTVESWMSLMEKPTNLPLVVSIIIIPFVKRRLYSFCDSGHAPF